MIDKLVDQLDFPGEPFWLRVRSFGPFRSKDLATAFMVKHEGRP